LNLLESDIKKSCEGQGYWFRRMRDVQMYAGSSSPFDYLVWDTNTLVGIEAKLLRSRKSGNPKSFPFSRLSEVQREGLLEFDQLDNSKGYIIINFRWINNKKGRCFALPITEFIYLEQALDRKSIPLDYFVENTLELPRKDKGWDLSLLF